MYSKILHITSGKYGIPEAILRSHFKMPQHRIYLTVQKQCIIFEG